MHNTTTIDITHYATLAPIACNLDNLDTQTVCLHNGASKQARYRNILTPVVRTSRRYNGVVNRHDLLAHGVHVLRTVDNVRALRVGVFHHRRVATLDALHVANVDVLLAL